MKVKTLCEICGKEFWLPIEYIGVPQQNIHVMKEKDVCK